MTQPLLCAVRKRFPESKIHVVASPRGYPALVGMRSIDSVTVLSPLKLSRINDISRALREERFDMSINVSEKIWGYVIPWLAAIPVRIGFYPGYTQPFKSLVWANLLTHRVFYANNPSKCSGEHEVERHVRLLHPLGIEEEPGPLRLDFQEDLLDWAKEYITSRRRNLSSDLISFHLSNKWIRNGWDEEDLKLVISSILNLHECEILVTYGEPEREWAERFVNGQEDSRIIPFYDSSFKKWAAVLAQSKMLITMDTGASHVASAINVPVIDIFPERFFAHCTERWHPWRVDYRLIQKKSLDHRSAKRGATVNEFLSKIMEAIEELSK